MNLSGKAKRRIIVYGGIILIATGSYYYQPMRIDFIRRVPPTQAHLKPDSVPFFTKGEKIAVVVAHPDDAEFYIGGTLTKLGQARADITLIVMTDGDKGYYPSFLTDAAANRKVRRAEQLKASATYHAKVIFMGGPDGRLRSNEETVQNLTDELKKIAPTCLICFEDNYWVRVSHNDHRNAGESAVGAATQVPSIHWVARFATAAPNYAIDISNLWDTKDRLLRTHASQFSGEKGDRVAAMVYDSAETQGKLFGFDLAEAFRCTSRRR